MITAVLIYLTIGAICGWFATRGGSISHLAYIVGVLLWPIAVCIVILESWRIWRRKGD